jgi:MYXO-CTERM domain-containing protein
VRLHTLFSVAALALGLWPASSQADIIFTLGNNPQPGEENVLLNKGTSGNTVFGETNQSHTLVQFDSTQTLLEPANGQARIEATDGTDQIGLTNVTITIPNGTYGDIIFNPSITGTVGVPGGTLGVDVTDNLNLVHSFDYELGNGNNFLTIVASAGQTIVSTSLTYSLGEGFTDLRQVRISGAQGIAVPEPSSLVMAGIGALGLGLVGVIRRRRTA